MNNLNSIAYNLINQKRLKSQLLLNYNHLTFNHSLIKWMIYPTVVNSFGTPERKSNLPE